MGKDDRFEGYNGWSNYATWNAHMWLTGSDEDMYNEAYAATRSCDTAEEAGEALKELVEKYAQPGDRFGDLDGAELATVNWPEVGESFIEMSGDAS